MVTELSQSRLQPTTLLQQDLSRQLAVADNLATSLHGMCRLWPSSRVTAWIQMHDAIARFEQGMHDSMLQLKDIDPGSVPVTTRAAIRDSVVALGARLESIDTAVEQLVEELKAKRIEVESKFKALEEQVCSDYDIFISFVKSTRDELYALNKGLGL